MEGSHHAREKIESIVFALYSPFPLLLTVKSTPQKKHETQSSGICLFRLLQITLGY